MNRHLPQTETYGQIKTKGTRKQWNFRLIVLLDALPYSPHPHPINCSNPICYPKLWSHSSNVWSLGQVPLILRSYKEGEGKSQCRELSRVVPGSMSQCLGRKGMVPKPGS